MKKYKIDPAIVNNYCDLVHLSVSEEFKKRGIGT